MAIDEKTIDEVKAANPGVELHLLTHEDEQAIFRVPDDGVWTRYWKELVDEDTRAQAHTTLVMGSVVYPAPVEFRKVLGRRPGLVQTFGARIAKLAGATKEAQSRKL